MNILSLQDVTWHYQVTTLWKMPSFFMGTTDSNTSSPPWARAYTNGSTRWIPLKIIHAGYLSQQYVDKETTTLGVLTNVLKQRDNIIMHPASCHMSDITISHLQNCPVTKEDVWAADDIFGPNLGSLKGKTVLRPNKHVQAGSSAVPRSILEIHRDVVLSVDIMFMNKIPFLVTSSHNIRFSMVESLPNCQVGTVATCLKKVTRLYHHRGFA